MRAREYRKLLGEIAEHKALLEGDDADLRELAKAELPTLQKRPAPLEEKIQRAADSARSQRR